PTLQHGRPIAFTIAHYQLHHVVALHDLVRYSPLAVETIHMMISAHHQLSDRRKIHGQVLARSVITAEKARGRHLRTRAIVQYRLAAPLGSPASEATELDIQRLKAAVVKPLQLSPYRRLAAGVLV